MTFLHNIRSVARYEAKTLRRSWFFRLFSIMAIVFLTFMNIGIFSPIGDESWEFISIPSSLPLINLYLLNIGQSIVVIFLAADFLRRDKKMDTNEVLYTRSMSNFEYVTGKTWGILRLFLGLNIVILSIGLLINIISKSMEVDLKPYLYYLLIISVPTLVFSLGLAFLLMSAIRNQAVTFLLLLGIAALDMFWLWFRAGFIFDYMAFGIPLFSSGIAGFDNLYLIINQRLLYFSLGVVMIMATILLFKRLPQSKSLRLLTIFLMTGFLGVSAVCALNTWSLYRNDLNVKAMAIETNRQFENRNFVTVTNASIDFIHKGSSFDAVARLKILNKNREEVAGYIFSLNPLLSVSKVTSGSKELGFKITGHIIEVNPEQILATGHTDSVEISYSGSISESFCYPDYTGNSKDNPYRFAMLNVNKRQAFLTDDYVLLTPETHWYPVAGLNYYPSNPATIKTDFANFSLRVKTRDDLTAVTQGIMNRDDDYFTSVTPLTGLTLAIGDYRCDTLKVDSTSYFTYYFPGHDYYKKDLAELKDTVPFLISRIMRELETNFSIKYPFNSLSLVEVPVQFHSHIRKNTQTRAEVQPSMILLPEKLSPFGNAGFAKDFSRQKKRMARQNQVISDKELQVRIFNNFVRNTFITNSNTRFVNGVPLNEPLRYILGPSFYFFRNNFYSSEYPVMNSVFESHLQKLPNFPRGGYQAMIGILPDNDRANLILKDISLRNLLEMNPDGDTLKIVLTAKGDYLFNLIRANAGIEEFRDWFFSYLDEHKFKSIDILQLDEDVNEKFGFRFYPYLDDWFNRKGQAGFMFTDLRVSEVVVNGRVRFQVTFVASNPEPVSGIFNVGFRTGGPGQGGQQRVGADGRGPAGQGAGVVLPPVSISKIILMDSLESKKIGIVLDRIPRMMIVNTLIAKNIPCEISLPVEDVIKSIRTDKEFTGEEKLESLPDFIEKSEKIVDNEDSGFINSNITTQSPLKKILGVKNRQGNTYRQISNMNAREHWQPAVQSNYYGKYVRSSVYTRGGAGDRKVTWSVKIDEPGYYDIYTYIGKAGGRMIVTRGTGGPGGARGPGGRGGPGGTGGTGGTGGPGERNDNTYKDMHYEIYHDEGMEEITLDYESAEGGWNNLGRYYISKDSAKVVLTNKSAGRIVIGDAVKWVKGE